jgi:hypothetical protein
MESSVEAGQYLMKRWSLVGKRQYSVREGEEGRGGDMILHSVSVGRGSE